MDIAGFHIHFQPLSHVHSGTTSLCSTASFCPSTEQLSSCSTVRQLEQRRGVGPVEGRDSQRRQRHGGGRCGSKRSNARCTLTDDCGHRDGALAAPPIASRSPPLPASSATDVVRARCRTRHASRGCRYWWMSTACMPATQLRHRRCTPVDNSPAHACCRLCD